MLTRNPPFALAILGAALLAAPATQADIKNVVATLETRAFHDDEAGGNADADDPAIWVNHQERGRSLVIATLKEGGLAVFNLKGEEIQHIAAPPPPRDGDKPGRFNNVDLLLGFDLNGKKADLAIVSDRGLDRLRIYAINPGYAASGLPPLKDVTAPELAATPWVFSANQDEVNDQTTAYGVAATNFEGYGPASAVVSQRSRTQLRRVVFFANKAGQVGYKLRDILKLPNEFKLPNKAMWTPCQDDDGQEAQVEGMVIDGLHGVLYAAQEQVGIWRISFTNGLGSKPKLIDKVRSYGQPYERTWVAEDEEYACEFKDEPGFGGTVLTADAEGLAIYPGKFGKGYLLASSQGDSTFAVYQRDGENTYLGGFQAVDDGKIDGAQHCDGAAVTNYALGADFPNGLLVLHDGENTPDALDESGEARANTNFKFVPWPSVANAFDKPLSIDTLR